MIDLIDNRTLLIVGCTALVLTGLIGVLSAIFLAWREDARRRQLVAVSEVTRDWQPTWRINAVTDAWVMEHEKDASSRRAQITALSTPRPATTSAVQPTISIVRSSIRSIIGAPTQCQRPRTGRPDYRLAATAVLMSLADAC